MSASRKPDSVTFSGKGQVVIPVWMRRLCGIEEGTTASITATADGILLKPITPAYIRSLRGKYKHLPLMETLAEDRKRERESWRSLTVAGGIATLPIAVVGVGDDLGLSRHAARFKAAHKLSLADAFAAALAKDRKADLVTGDPEFKALEKEVKIVWLK